MLNAPPKQVIGDNGFGRGVELVGNEDVTRIIVILIPLAQNNYKLDGNLTIFQFCLKRVRSMRNFRAIRGLILDCFGFVPIMLFDEGHELIWFNTTLRSFYRMVHEDISV